MKKRLLLLLTPLLLIGAAAVIYLKNPCILGHEVTVTPGTPATCTASGLSDSSYCSRCNAILSVQQILPTAEHTAGTLIVDVPSTCQTKGSGHIPCSDCGETLSIVTVNISTHSFGEWITICEASCSAPGKRVQQCLYCEEHNEETTPATAHSISSWIIDAHPSCDAQGMKHQTCSACNTHVIETIPAQAHNYQKVQERQPNCTSAGFLEEFCDQCADTRYTVLPATSHIPAAWQVISNPTETREGLQQRYCSVSGCQKLLEIRTIPATAGAATLSYSINEDGTSCTVTGVVSASSTTLYIPSEVEGYTVTAIAPFAFNGNRRFTSISIPSSVTHVGYGAFTDCSAITTAPDGIQYIGAWAVGAAEATSAASVREGTVGIADLAFLSHPHLSSLSLPQSLLFIGVNPFAGCSLLQQLTLSDEESFRYTSGCLVELATKTLISGIKGTSLPTDVAVTRIGDLAFMRRQDLTTLSIPATVTEIGLNPFAGCTALTALSAATDARFQVIRRALVDQETSTLISSPSSATLPSGITEIADLAFLGNTALTSITIPATVTKIGRGVFADCPLLRAVHVDAQNPVYRAVQNCVILMQTNTLVAGIGTSVIPDNITGIQALAFCAQELLELTLPASLTQLEPLVFAGCHKLVHLTNLCAQSIDYLPQNIGFEMRTSTAQSFQNALQTDANGLVTLLVNGTLYLIDVPVSLETLDLGTSAITALYPHALYYRTALQTLRLPEALTVFGQDALRGCTGIKTLVSSADAMSHISKSALTSVTLHSGSRLEYADLRGATKLTHLLLSPSILYVATDALSDCTALREVEIPACVLGHIPTTALTHVTVTSGTSIPRNAFAQHTSLVYLSLSPSIKSFGDGAFDGCTNITTAIIPCEALKIVPRNSLAHLTIEGGTTIPAECFKLCSTLITLHIGESVTTIANGAFFECANLLRVTFDKNSKMTTWSGKYNFVRCRKLKSIEIPAGLTALPEQSLAGCWALTDVIFAPNSKLTTLGPEVFRGDTALKSIVLPDGITTIGYDLFDECTALTTATLPSTLVTVGATPFKGCTSIKYVTAPCSALSQLVSTNITHLTVRGGTSVPDTVFLNTTVVKKLVSITIGKDITRIGNQAFRGASSLTTLTFEDGSALKSFGGVSCFRDCTRLSSVKLPDGLTELPLRNFQNCTALKTVYIPKSLTQIDFGAFASCRAITHVYYEGSETDWNAIVFTEGGAGTENTYLTNAARTYNYAF